MNHYDIIIIGSGPGGYKTAGYAASKGLSVAIVEEGEAGGTCLNRGCIPTKSLCHDATQLPRRSFAEAIQRKQAVVNQLRAGVETLMSRPGITLIRGKATLAGHHTVSITRAEKSPFECRERLRVGERSEGIAACRVENHEAESIEADNIIIATGSSPKTLPIEGAHLPHVLTSDQLLQLQTLPRRMCIIGAGVIGMEFAHIFNAFGSQVTVVEYLKECLPASDSDLAKRLRKTLEKRGVAFFMQSAVKRITADGVVFERKGKEQTVEIDGRQDIILMATGRKPNTDGLNLDAAGVTHTCAGISVHPHTMQTSVESIYAIGDVNGQAMLAHAATFQGRRAVNHILGQSDHIRLGIMPAAVFTTPELADVGLTEDQCKEKGLPCTCHKALYRSNGKALAMEQTDGLLKLVADGEGRIVGCHALGAHAADLVQEIAALMNRDTTLAQLRDIIHIHPTLSEILID